MGAKYGPHRVEHWLKRRAIGGEVYVITQAEDRASVFAAQLNFG